VISPLQVVRRAGAPAVLLALLWVPARAQTGTRDEPFAGTTQVTAVEIVVAVEDASGRLPDDLGPADFEVLEDGAPAPVVAVEVWRRGTVVRRAAPGEPARVEVSGEPPWSWHTVIYFDQVLSSSRSIRRVAEALAAQAGRLTRLGTVEIVVANPSAEQVLPPTRSGALVESALAELARRATGRDELRRIRRQLVYDQQVLGVRSVREGQIAVHVAQEFDLLRRQHDVLTAAIAGATHEGPRALLLVNDGYDLRPIDFYSQFLGSHLEGAGSLSRTASSQVTVSALQADAGRQAVATDVEQLARSLAAGGWVTVNLALGALDAGAPVVAEMTGRGRSGDLDLRGRTEFNAEGVDEVVARPLDPGHRLAQATGGSVLTGVGALPDTLERLGDRVRLTYQVERPADGELHAIEVRARRPGLAVSAPRWAGSTAPEAVAAARARRLLAGGADHGELTVTAAVALEPAAAAEPGGLRRGRLQARVDLRPLAASLAGAAATPVRVTVAASFAAGEPFVRHESIDGQELAGLDAWTYGLPLALPRDIERLSVVFEELTTGAWGGAQAAIVEGALPAEVEAAGASDAEPAAGVVPADLLPDRKAILLVPPREAVVRGRMQLETVVAEPRIARVEYRLDGRPVGAAKRPPFAARVDFGELPAPHLLEAVAFDAAGAEVGRDGLTVNEGVGPFRVRIIEPRSGERAGAVDVEAEVKAPGGAGAVERVEVTWNGRRVATLFEPPYRARVFVPPEAPVGWISVEAHAGGAVAEDVVFLNGTAPGERLEVELVELFTVVADAAERPVRGLVRDDFRIYEDGAAQALAEFRDGVEVPLALGLVIDTSASMTPALSAAQTAAIDFLLLSLQGERDRALVVGFDARPRLVQPLTSSRQELVDAIAGLRPGGHSALCDALVFSLVQLQRVPGRRAVVVLTDGVGREERVDYGTCLRFVQRSGIPVYAILLAGDDPTAARQGGVDAGRLEPLVGAVGGRLFVAAGAGGLGGVYRAVGEDLRSQYLLTYYPRRSTAGGEEEWREVEVEVGRPGLVARTLAGYYR